MSLKISNQFLSSPIEWSKNLCVFILWGILFLPVYPGLWDTWMNSSNNSHGILVPFISAYLIWTKKDKLAAVSVSSSKWGLIILASSIFFYILALGGHVTVIQRIMLVSSLAGLVLFNFGSSIFKILAFPLLYLFFMVPVPISIYSLTAMPLQLFATDIARFIIQTLNIPVLQEGNMLYFAQTQLEVAEACSGLRSMTAFVMLGVLFAYLMDKGPWRQIILVLSAIPLAIFANVIRVTGTGILAHFYGKEAARGFLHEFSGMAVFVFGFILLFLEYKFLSKPATESIDAK